jgi:hypothetical protein
MYITVITYCLLQKGCDSMEKKLFRVLNTLGVVACAATLILMGVLWGRIKPQELPKEMVEINRLLEERREQRPLTAPKEKKKIEGTPESARDVAAVRVIASHINGFMLSSFEGALGMTRKDYIDAIAEALVEYSKSQEEAFWLCGMMQTESSFRLGARPGKSTNSSARGLLQVIVRYHGDVLNPAGISKLDLASDINKSVLGGVLVFHKYRYPRRGGKRTLREATRRYRSLSASEAAQAAYYNAANAVFQKLMKDFKKEVKSL